MPVTYLPVRIISLALRIALAGMCAFGIWLSWKQIRADYFYHLDSAESLRAAIRVEPDNWKYYMRLAALDDEDAQQLLETAVRLDAYNAEADIELGLRLEEAGDNHDAERVLLNAFAVDHTYFTRWTLANFYLRHDNLAAFWMWAKRAAEMPSNNAGPLFELCWHASPDPNEITQKILNNKPELLRQYLDYLLSKDQPSAASDIAHRLIQFGDPTTDTARLFATIGRLVATKDGMNAKSLWGDLASKHWVVADTGLLNNPNFAREPLPVDFDWTLNSYSGLHSWTGQSGLETEFTGVQPEQCIVAQQAMVLAPGNYVLDYSYRTQEIRPRTGLRWQVVAVGTETPLAESTDLSSNTLHQEQMYFSIPEGSPPVYLRLKYQRALGTTRISGTLAITSVSIHARP